MHLYAAIAQLMVGVTVMPLGDSLTVGCHEYSSPTPASYRFILQDSLRAQQIPYEFVGPNSAACGGVGYDNHHAGFSGESISSVTNRAATFIDTFDPDIVLLLVGTNDYYRDASHDLFVAYYNKLFDTLGNRTVYIATVPRLGYDRPGDATWTREFVDNVNNRVFTTLNGVIHELAGLRENVHVVEYSELCDPQLHLVSDKVHPNRNGQVLLAGKFFEAAFSSNGTRGDVNRDGRIDVLDLTLVSSLTRLGRFEFPADLNKDGTVAENDRLEWIYNLFQTTSGDANLDHAFNSSDLVQVFQRGQFEDDVSHNSSWADGDWDNDGDFTTHDIVAAFQDGSYEKASARASLAVVVPEPGSLMIVQVCCPFMLIIARSLRYWSIRRTITSWR